MLILILVLIGQQTCHLTKFKVTAGTHWILRTVDTHTAGSATTAIDRSFSLFSPGRYRGAEQVRADPQRATNENAAT